MVQMTVSRVVMNQQGHAFVLLADRSEERLLPIWIGLFEADAIARKIQGEEFERPFTHDLLMNTIEQLGYELERIEITKLEDKIFYALVHLSNGAEEYAIDSRPSDAIALAVRAAASIFVAEQVLDEAQLLRDEIDPDVQQQRFRELMQSVEPPEEAEGDDPTDTEDMQ